jgi:hypothetical protein
MKRFIFWCGAVLLFPLQVLAYDDDGTTGFGRMASHLVRGPMTVLMSFMDDACYVAGVILLLVAFNKYLRYRENPQETPISTPIVYLILGIGVILLPLAYYLVQAANR